MDQKAKTYEPGAVVVGEPGTPISGSGSSWADGSADASPKPLDPEIVKKKVAVFVNLSRRRE